ncbi:MAG: type VI secretion system tube protein Hcp [Bacteroidota bacterium]
MKPFIFIWAIACWTAFTQTSAQSYEYYLLLPNVRGPVASLPGQSGTGYFQLGCLEHQFTGPGSGLGTFQHREIVVKKPIDPASSPRLQQAILNNTLLNSVSILVYQRSNSGTLTAYYAIELSNARIGEFTVAADNGNTRETFTLSYAEIRWVDPVSGVRLGWDVINDRAIP